jgi:Histidine kinase-, DNA gyrase B-, and HSP90-like ATPase
MNNLVENNIMGLIPQFLNKGVSHTRQSIQDIDDSYNNEWDILAELIQNSVDAIRESKKTKGKINLKVDCQNKVIAIEDDGIGIDKDAVLELLALFGTNKKNKEDSIGEKGVGLKFAIFSCNDFSLKTSNGNNATQVIIKDAYVWKKSTDETNLPLDKEDILPNFSGTQIILKDVQDSPIFDLTIDQLKFIIRTKTAIGNVNTLFEINDPKIECELNFTNPIGTFKKEDISFSYWLPIEELKKTSIIDIKDYYQFIGGGHVTDLQKRQKLRDKIVTLKKEFQVGNRFVYAYACLMPSRDTWSLINKSNNLADETMLKDDKFLQDYSYAIMQPGIFVSVKGMPTGIKIEHPITGQSGSWGSIFMLFEDRKLKFDIGRKSIHGRTQKVYQEYARDIFNEFRNNIMKNISGDGAPESSQWDRDEVFATIESMVPLNNPNTKFTKSPKDQEASVAAIFFECIGNGKIKEITPFVSGYKNKYDLFGAWSKRKVSIEFKSRLRNIIDDVKNFDKLFNEFDCIVCWDVSETDEQELIKNTLTLEKIEEKSVFSKTEETFPHSTHILRYSNFAKPIFIIDMKIVLES